MRTTTEKELRQYQNLNREAEDLQKRIDKLYDKDISTGHSTVKGSSRGFPYTEFRMGVWVHDPKEIAARDKLIAIYQERLDMAQESILRIEQFISDIWDSELRQIFQYRYIDGMKLREIGDKMSMDFTGVGKKIKAYLNFQQNQQNTC